MGWKDFVFADPERFGFYDSLQLYMQQLLWKCSLLGLLDLPFTPQFQFQGYFQFHFTPTYLFDIASKASFNSSAAMEKTNSFYIMIWFLIVQGSSRSGEEESGDSGSGVNTFSSRAEGPDSPISTRPSSHLSQPSTQNHQLEIIMASDDSPRTTTGVSQTDHPEAAASKLPTHDKVTVLSLWSSLHFNPFLS